MDIQKFGVRKYFLKKLILLFSKDAIDQKGQKYISF